MKIGILTMHAVPNYGSFLQAYSLKRQMEQRGADVRFLRLKQGRQILPQPAGTDALAGKLRPYLNRYALQMLLNRRIFGSQHTGSVRKNHHRVPGISACQICRIINLILPEVLQNILFPI